MTETQIVHKWNSLQIIIAWIATIGILFANYMIVMDGDPRIFSFLATMLFLFMLVTTFLHIRKKCPITIMYGITIFSLFVVGIVNYVSHHFLNIIYCFIPPLLSIMYQQWKNTLFSVMGSFLIVSLTSYYFGNEIYGKWETHYLINIFDIYLIFALITISLTRALKALRIQALENERHVITEKEKLFEESKKKIRYLTYHDTLTGLPNRNFFYEWLESQIIKVYQHSLAVIFLNLDNFKRINDSVGHKFGDNFLKKVAMRIKEIVGKTGTVFRLDGDEFAVVVTKVKKQNEIRELAERLKEMLFEPFIINDMHVYVSASIGVAMYPEHGQTPETLLKNANIAMYRAKEKGKSHVQFFSAEDTHDTIENIILESDLRKAIENEELDLYYQPQIDLKTNKLIGFEALIRWNHPTKGLISPAKFIPLAEQTELIISIGEWVLRKATKQLKEWQTQYDSTLRVAINLSPKQFLKPDFVSNLKKIIDDAQIDPQFLDLEITESMMMNVEENLSLLLELKQIGVRISIDDFGTGYSSLSYLKKFPVDQLKIDQSFVRDMETENDKAIVAMIISMANQLNLEVVAEGVENKTQLEILHRFGCDVVQGYYISMPLPTKEIEERVFPKVYAEVS
jgi:diguanylate cyclase